MRVCLVLAIGLFIVTVKAMDKEDAKEMFRNMSQDCKEQEKASDKDVDTMVDEKYPETREGKCMVACMQEQFGIVKETKFSKDGFMAVASMAAGDDKDKLKAAEEIADECKTVTNTDRCEQAIDIGKCMENGAKNRNFSA